MPTVSVIIPYYNSESTIIRAIESAVTQTFTDFEIVLVDDGSNDNTHIIVDDYIKKNKGIAFNHYSQENAGPSEARNLGISKSDAKYIAFLDSDDSWVSPKLEIQIKLMAENKIDLLGSNINIEETNGKIIRKYYIKSQLEYISFYKLLFKHYFCASSVVIRKKVLDDIGGFPHKQKYAEDTLLFARITRKYKTAVSNDFLVNIYKPLFGESGLSGNLKETNKYILKNFEVLRRENTNSPKKIGHCLYLLALLFSNIKYFRKISISFLRKVFKNNIERMTANSHMNKKHIVFILQGGKGGTQEYIKMLLEYLDKDKYELTVICHGETYEELKNLEYNVHYVKMVREISIVKDFVSLKNILSYLKKNKTDIVYSHSSKGGVLGRTAAGLLRIPNLYNPHGWSFNMKISNRKKNFYTLVEKIVSKFADKIIMISETEYNDALLRGIADRNKLILITNGVDLGKFNKKNGDDFKQSLNIPKYFKVVGMMGRFTEQKSPQTFVEVAKIVTDSYPKCKFILIGDGELKNTLETMASKLNLDKKLILVGWVNDPEKYISIMDVGVLTSKWEGFGLVLAEMMASGKPVVASEVDGVSFVVRNNFDGFLCKPDDVKGFAKYILRLLNEDDLYKSMSESAYKHAREKFDLKRVIQQHETIFDSF